MRLKKKTKPIDGEGLRLEKGCWLVALARPPPPGGNGVTFSSSDALPRIRVLRAHLGMARRSSTLAAVWGKGQAEHPSSVATRGQSAAPGSIARDGGAAGATDAGPHPDGGTG